MNSRTRYGQRRRSIEPRNRTERRWAVSRWVSSVLARLSSERSIEPNEIVTAIRSTRSCSSIENACSMAASWICDRSERSGSKSAVHTYNSSNQRCDPTSERVGHTSARTREPKRLRESTVGSSSTWWVPSSGRYSLFAIIAAAAPSPHRDCPGNGSRQEAAGGGSGIDGGGYG